MSLRFLRSVRNALRNRYRTVAWTLARWRHSLRTRKRIVVGAGGTRYPGWLQTDREHLDLLREADWRRLCAPDSLAAILAEHVWEHLTPEDASVAARQCLRYLKPGGLLRIAVPDGLHPDPAYVDYVRPGGPGAGSDDHKVLYTFRSLGELFSAAGFEVHLLEYFDEAGQFHRQPWDLAEGFIQRSAEHDDRNADGRLAYTSIILDARKPV